MPSTSYESEYHRRLRTPRYARGLLKVAFEESSRDGNWSAFGLLLQDIVAASGAKSNFAKRSKISRQHLYRLFGKQANPTLKTLAPVLSELGLKLTLIEDAPRKKAA